MWHWPHSSGNCTMSPTNCVALTIQHRKLYNVTHKLRGTDLTAQETVQCHPQTVWHAANTQHMKRVQCHPQTVWHWPLNLPHSTETLRTAWRRPHIKGKRQCCLQTVWHWPYRSFFKIISHSPITNVFILHKKPTTETGYTYRPTTEGSKKSQMLQCPVNSHSTLENITYISYNVSLTPVTLRSKPYGNLTNAQFKSSLSEHQQGGLSLHACHSL